MTQPRHPHVVLLAVSGLLALSACNNNPVTPPAPGPKATLTLNGVADGQAITGTSVNVTASVDGVTPDAVTFTLDGQLVVKNVNAPYSFRYDKLSNRQHGLTVTATLGTKTLVSKDVLFTSQGPLTRLSIREGMACNTSISQSVTLTPQFTGALSDQVEYSITRDGATGAAGRGGGTITINPDTYSSTPPRFTINPGLLLNLDDTNGATDPVPMTLKVWAVNRDYPTNLPINQDTWTCQFSVPKSAALTPINAYFDEFDHKANNWNHQPWQTITQDVNDSFVFNFASPPAVDNLANPTYVAAHTVRGPTSTNSRFVFPLDKPLTDKNTFQFWMVFRVTGRSSEVDEWKVGRVGLVSTTNTTPSEGGAVKTLNNNINSVQFEIEAQYNYVAGFFAMINLGNNLPDCANTQDPACARRDTRRIGFDPTISANDQTHPTAGLNKWMKVTCTYTGDLGNAITGLPDRSFSCNGRNDEDGIDLGSTTTIQLGVSDTFTVDAYGLFSSGRPTNGETTSLDWQAGRTMLTIWK